jgi:hypothetical protein
MCFTIQYEREKRHRRKKMIGFLLLMGISNAAAIGFCAAGYSVANMKVPERTPEEIREDSIKGVVYSLIAINIANLSSALLVPQIASQKVEGIVDVETVFTGLLTLVCIARIVTIMFWLWMELVKELKNEEQEKKQENGNK